MGAACWRSRCRWRTPRSAKRRVQRVHASAAPKACTRVPRVAFRRDAEEDDVPGATAISCVGQLGGLWGTADLTDRSMEAGREGDPF